MRSSPSWATSAPPGWTRSAWTWHRRSPAVCAPTHRRPPSPSTPFHAVKAVTDALDTVRRAVWQQMRATDPTAAHKFKGARWALLKRPDHLTDEQAGTLRKLRRRGGQLWRAYTLREAFRGHLRRRPEHRRGHRLIDRWIAKASRSRIDAMVKTAKTIRKRRDGILPAIRLRINNGRAEGLNNHVRLIINRAYGFHSADAAPLW